MKWIAYFIWQGCGSKVRHKRLRITALDIAANLSVIFFLHFTEPDTKNLCAHPHTGKANNTDTGHIAHSLEEPPIWGMSVIKISLPVSMYGKICYPDSKVSSATLEGGSYGKWAMLMWRRVKTGLEHVCTLWSLCVHCIWERDDPDAKNLINYVIVNLSKQKSSSTSSTSLT